MYSQYVYDMDLIDGDYTQTQTIQSVRLPLWGVCRENTSVLATIENGASLAAISADVAGRNNSYNNAFAMFTLRGSGCCLSSARAKRRKCLSSRTTTTAKISSSATHS